MSLAKTIKTEDRTCAGCGREATPHHLIEIVSGAATGAASWHPSPHPAPCGLPCLSGGVGHAREAARVLGVPMREIAHTAEECPRCRAPLEVAAARARREADEPRRRAEAEALHDAEMERFGRECEEVQRLEDAATERVHATRAGDLIVFRVGATTTVLTEMEALVLRDGLTVALEKSPALPVVSRDLGLSTDPGEVEASAQLAAMGVDVGVEWAMLVDQLEARGLVRVAPHEHGPASVEGEGWNRIERCACGATRRIEAGASGFPCWTAWSP